MSNDSELNPYEAPKNTTAKRTKKKKAAPEEDSHENHAAIDAIVFNFQKTRPWISLFGTLSFIGAVAIVVLGFYTMSSTGTSRQLGDFGAIAFILYLVLAVLYVIIGARLFRYRDSINQLIAADGRLDFIARAVERQREFWAFVGVLTVALLGLYLLLILGGVMFALGR